jgi:hypothetical protein
MTLFIQKPNLVDVDLLLETHFGDVLLAATGNIAHDASAIKT